MQCENLKIYGMDGSNSLSMECDGIEPCKNAIIFGFDLMYVHVKCIGFESCKNTNFYGNNTNLLNIECLHINGSCQNMNVFCPFNHNGCIMSNNNNKQSNDIHTHLDFYAIYGFEDLDILQYKATLICNENSTNMMHCGMNYKSFCKLDAISLFCECNYNINQIFIKQDGNDVENRLNSTEIAIIISGIKRNKNRNNQ